MRTGRSRRIRILLVGTALACAAPASSDAAVLYDQTNSFSASSFPSNDFSVDSADEQVADDFTVPAGQGWQISQVDVVGQLDGNPPPLVNAYLYSNSGTLPGAEVFHQGNIPATGPNYSVPLSGAPVLMPGTYWVSVQQAGAGFMVPSWDWTDRTVQSGNPAAAQNPGGNYFSMCTTWTARNVCTVDPNPDQVFDLSGTATSNLFTFGKLKRNAKRGTAQLTVNAPGPGTLDLSGKGLVPRRSGHRSGIGQVERTVNAAGAVKLPIKAKGKAKRKLNRRGKVMLKATVTYTSTGASPSSQRKKLRLKKRLP